MVFAVQVGKTSPVSFPAGWYDDPEDPTQQRYWDGSAWTDQRRAHDGPPPYQGQFGQPTGTQPYGQTAQHGQVYGGAQPGPAQYGQPQYGQYGGQPGAQHPVGQQQYPAYPQAGQGYGYPGQRGQTTPDGQPLSGWWRRVFAWIIDGIIVWIIALPLTGYFYYQYAQVIWGYLEDVVDEARAGRSTTSFTLPPEAYKWLIPAALLGFLVSFVYQYLFLTKKGATPGKMALGIAVRLRDVPGHPPAAAVAKRCGFDLALSLAGLVPLIGTLAAFISLLNGLWPLWDDKKQALHDKVAGTNVVRT
jgi:uncharacterized RDD family membrane protein YckC